MTPIVCGCASVSRGLEQRLDVAAGVPARRDLPLNSPISPARRLCFSLHWNKARLVPRVAHTRDLSCLRGLRSEAESVAMVIVCE